MAQQTGLKPPVGLWCKVRASFERWAPKVFWAVADQGLFAVSNFAVSVLLARWLVPESYGAFATAFSLFLLLGTGHTALVTEPLLVLGAGKPVSTQDRYLRAVVVVHFAVALAGSILLALAAIAGRALGADYLLVRTVITSCGVSPFILMLWLARKACYVVAGPRLAATAGAAYLLLIVAGLLIIVRSGRLTPETAFGLVGACSLAAGGWLLWRLRMNRVLSVGLSEIKEVAAAHWRYGRWAVGTAALSWLPANLFFVVLPWWESLEATATLKAAMNLVLPILHTISAIGVVLLPAFVRRGADDAGRLVGGSLTLLCSGALVYWALVGFFGERAGAVIYDGQYTFGPVLLWLVGALPLTAATVAVLGNLLRARERPDQIFWAYVGGSIATLTVGLALTAVAGVKGSMAGMIGASMVVAVLTLRASRGHRGMANG